MGRGHCPRDLGKLSFWEIPSDTNHLKIPKKYARQGQWGGRGGRGGAWFTGGPTNCMRVSGCIFCSRL